MEGRPRSQPDDLINFRQLRSNALQAAELDIYDGDDIRLAGIGVFLGFSAISWLSPDSPEYFSRSFRFDVCACLSCLSC